MRHSPSGDSHCCHGRPVWFFQPTNRRSLPDDERCLVMVKQSNDYPITQAAVQSVSQTNNVKSIFQTVNTNMLHYLDCLTVDRPAAETLWDIIKSNKIKSSQLRDSCIDCPCARIVQSFYVSAVFRTHNFDLCGGTCPNDEFPKCDKGRCDPVNSGHAPHQWDHIKVGTCVVGLCMQLGS